ncbi:MAG: transposase [Gemmatimonadetes bacterium]|nr:transposase [Gemmatimonadota bacterium]
MDGLYEPLRTHGIQKDGLLVAWAVTIEGEKVLLSLRLGGKESHEAWLEFLRDLVARDLVTRRYLSRSAALGVPQVGAAMRALVEDETNRNATAIFAQDPRLNSIMRTTCGATMREGGHARNAVPQPPAPW